MVFAFTIGGKTITIDLTREQKIALVAGVGFLGAGVIYYIATRKTAESKPPKKIGDEEETIEKHATSDKLKVNSESKKSPATTQTAGAGTISATAAGKKKKSSKAKKETSAANENQNAASVSKKANSTTPSTSSSSQKDKGKEKKETEKELTKSDLAKGPLDAATRLKNDGNKLFNKAQYAEAIEKYSEAILLCPKDEIESAKFYCNRAACYAKLNQHEKVIEDCTIALEIDPRYGKAFQRRGHAYEALDKLSEAIDDYGAANSLSENDASLQSSISRVLERVGNEKATIAVSERKGTYPADRVVKTYLASFQQSGYESMITKAAAGTTLAKITAEIEAESEAAAPINGNDNEGGEKNANSSSGEPGKETASQRLSRLHAIRGEILMEEGKYVEALEDFERAISLDDKNCWAYIQAGTLLHLSNNLSRALELMNKALDISPENIDALVRKANIAFLQGEHERSLEIFEDAISKDPKRTAGLFHSAQALQHVGLIDAALASYDKLLKINEKDYDAWNQRGLALYQYSIVASQKPDQKSEQIAQYLQEASHSFNKAIKIDPKRVEAYNSFGFLYQGMGLYDEAKKSLNKAIELDPSSAVAYTNLGLLYSQVYDDFDKAKNYHLKAITADSKCIEARCNLAMLYFTRGMLQDALVQYDKALELSFIKQDLSTIYAFKEACLSRSRNLAKGIA